VITATATRSALDALSARYAADADLEVARGRATHLVPGEGSLRPRVVLVGEAPGGDEDRIGRPFVGRAGRFLDSLLAEHGIVRHETCWTTNVVKYWPGPGNPDPGPWELYVSLPYLLEEIELLDPPLIATLGRISGKALCRELPPITRCHGQARVYGATQVHLPMLHPAYGLRPGNREAFEHDVAALASLLRRDP
jgi:uracil-DNA glycosylase